VLIRRCAWHRSYRGYPLAFGIASWRGLSISFTDGMCLGCSARLRRQWNLPPLAAGVAPFGLHGGLVRVAAMAVMLVSVVLAARPLDDLRILRAVVPPPQTVLVPPDTVDEEPMPSLAVAHVSRRATPPPAASSSRRPSASWTEIARPAGASYLAVTVAHTVMPPVPPAVKTLRFPSWVVVASVPHAGLTEQTP
jgi:hypothetical protein